MKYPKSKAYTFVQFAEFDVRQVNLSKGRIYNYWWIQPNSKHIRLKKGQIPEMLAGFDISELGDY